ncbi:endonuclease/exonuclease/phosphatase family protein [Corallococcus sp. CA049B]|uniref:endonuclease/exonuclease/phosphatase family protein n=1 Tax=Corallococcus sp. CA049B TaxID=2316730 RepID=UPI000EA08804|nr:endonuclease/exonuclease/phosphatase family protein [Corallococcus sp. CA049B]RKG80241.1 endonuclease/exonuclease/phosphatase family protein [Corallococcus sp. CA049B]
MKMPEVLEHLPAVGHLLGRKPGGQEDILPKRDPTLTLPDFQAVPLPSSERRLGDGRTFIVHHPSPRAPRGPGLTVMSYNILMGGERQEALLEYFTQLEAQDRMPDVIGLQEAGVPMSVLLASRFGFHLAYQGSDGDDGTRLVNGKAWLSRHPIVDAAHFTYVLTDAERNDAIARQGYSGELVEDRGVLWLKLQVEGRPLYLYNLHHALGDSAINALNLRQLNALLRRREGVPAVVLGDFNANTAIKRGGSWLVAHLLHPKQDNDTDTIEEFRQRYGDDMHNVTVGDRGVGNIADPRLRHELHMMEQDLPETVCHATTVRVRLADHSLTTPHHARQELSSGQIPKHSPAWWRLQDIADCATLTSHPDSHGVVHATGKRFDNFYATRSLVPVLFEVDRSTESSDHQPVMAHYRFGDGQVKFPPHH